MKVNFIILLLFHNNMDPDVDNNNNFMFLGSSI